MENTQTQTPEQVVPVDNTTDYIEAMKNLKANSVSRKDYEALQADNKRLLDALSDTTTNVNSQPEVINKRSLEEIRSDLFGKEHNNLEYWETALELRDRVLEEQHKDIFLPVGHNYQATDEDITTASKVADVVRQCIDFAEGDSELFTNELQRRTNDSSPILNRKGR